MIIRTKVLAIFIVLMTSLPAYAETQTWYFVRHFEKQSGDNPSLTDIGKARAESLATFLFVDKPLTQVYSTDYHRTLETATPVSVFKNLPITVYDPRNLVGFATKLKTLDHVLVVGHSNTTAQILSLMGGEDITLEESIYIPVQ